MIVQALLTSGAYEVRDTQVIKYYSFAGQTIAVKDANGLQYFLTDHLGSVVAVTDSSGTLTSQQRYLPFGAVRELPNYPTTELTTDYGYTGQRSLGGDLGLMDYRARFYDPYLSRFLQPDSLIPSAGNPQAFNRYSYVANRPVNFNDPTGHKWDDCGERTGYACKIHMKQVGILKAQWKKEEAVAAATREAAIADAMARIEGLDPGIIPGGGSGDRGRTPTPSTTIEIAISYLQYSPIGLMLYNMMMEQGFTIAYGAPGSGGMLDEKNKIIYVSPDYSPTYIAGTIAHESMHYQVGKSDMLPRLEEYRALLVGDAVRAQIVSAGYGTSSVLRNPLSSYTVDINIADPAELQTVLDAWFLANEDY